MNTCGCCHRELEEPDGTKLNPASDCGGDCWECVSLCEGREDNESLAAYVARLEHKEH